MENIKFGAFVRLKRKDLGISVNRFSNTLGISVCDLKNIEKGIFYPADWLRESILNKIKIDK